MFHSRNSEANVRRRENPRAKHRSKMQHLTTPTFKQFDFIFEESAISFVNIYISAWRSILTSSICNLPSPHRLITLYFGFQNCNEISRVASEGKYTPPSVVSKQSRKPRLEFKKLQRTFVVWKYWAGFVICFETKR